MKNHIFYHCDLDGSCSAAIVLKLLRELDTDLEVDCMPVDYKDGIQVDDVDEDDIIYLVDFTPSRDDFESLLCVTDKDNIIWIDHHQTNIDKVVDLFDGELPKGSLSDDLPSASMLAHDFLFDGKPSLAVTLVDKWDTWTHNNDTTVLDFVWAAKSTGIEYNPTSEYWMRLLSNDDRSREAMGQLMIQGRAARSFDQKQMESKLSHHGFDVNVPTSRSSVVLRGKALNCGLINSFAFKSCENKGYDVWVTFYFDGNQYTVSLYKARDDLDVHLGQLASDMGGGGHAGAAGFQCKELPEWMIRLENDEI
ncbi:MAG: hypothetical protein GF411_08805 [Candidatus Lokiarchaeota archaeon]|nr:hypothetical protein [Candidatus Lokiarchaeota archaeon]